MHLLLNFDNTYIFLFGYKIFEPMVLLTNVVFFVFALVYFLNLNKYRQMYSRQMAWFMLCLGTSSIFGAVAHAVHDQMGELFLRCVVFIMNALSLLSIYFCFRSAYTLTHLETTPAKRYIYLVQVWVAVLLIACVMKGDFLLIKVHAGIVLLYSLVAHYLVNKKTQYKGSRVVVLGILVSFLPILVHTLRFSLHEWFNYKDLAHVIMIVSLIVIHKGVSQTSDLLVSGESIEPVVLGS